MTILIIILLIARNFANGKGVVFNENVPTNGFHPLFFLILIPIFYFFNFDIYLPIYISLFILCLFNIGTGILLYYIGKEAYNKRAGIIASSFWLFNPYLINVTLLGLETPIQIFFISTLIYYSIKIKKKRSVTLRDSFVVASLISLIILSRLDGIFFLVSIILVISFNEIIVLKRRNQFKFLNFFRIIKKKEIFIIFFIPTLVFLFWMLWSFFSTGHFAPTSAGIKTIETLLVRDDQYFIRLRKVVEMLIAFPINMINYRPGDNILQITLFFLYFGIPIIFAFFTWLFKKDQFLKELLKLFDFLIIAFSLYLVYYIFYQMNVWPWYALYPCFFVILFFSLCLSYMINKINDIKTKNKMMAKILSKKTISLLFLIIFSMNFTYNYHEINTHRTNEKQYDIRMDMIEYVEENIPEDEKIGSFNTGILQYFSLKRDIINLDGAVNTESYNAKANGNFSDYLIEKGIKYLLDGEQFGKILNKSKSLDLTTIKYFGYSRVPYRSNFKDKFYLWKIEESD